MTQDRNPSKDAMVASWSGGVNVRAQGHDMSHLSILV